MWDIRASRGRPAQRAGGFAKIPLWLQAQNARWRPTRFTRPSSSPTSPASTFTPCPRSHRDGPIYLNVLRHLDIPQAAALAAERSTVAIYTRRPDAWSYPQKVATALGWGDKRVQIRQPLAASDTPSR